MILGKTPHERQFAVDLLSHKAVFGMTGTGKSALLGNHFAQLVRAGHGAALIDFHGDLAEHALSVVPQERTNDVIYLDPTRGHVPNINMFELNGHDPSLVVSHFTRIMENLWPGQQIMARSKWLLRNLAFAVITSEYPVSILALEKLFHDKTYRKKLTLRLDDPLLRQFFDEYESWSKRFREEVITPVLNKVNALTSNPYVRAVYGQPRSSFSFRQMMDRRQILIARLPKGLIGDDAAHLIGSGITTKFSLAALSRADAQVRTPYFLIADEVQNCIKGIDLSTALSESRKYGLFFTVATQTLSQLTPESRAAIFGNCNTLISFRVSGEDATILSREFSGDVAGNTLHDIPNYKCRVRTLSGPVPTTTELVSTYLPIPGSDRRREKVMRASLRRYGRPKQKIFERAKRFLS